VRRLNDVHTVTVSAIHRALNGVSFEVAKAVVATRNTICATIDDEALEGDALRIFDVHYVRVPSRRVVDPGTWICNQGEPVKALNNDVLLARAGDADCVWLGGIEMGENTRNAPVAWLVAASNGNFVIFGVALACGCLAGEGNYGDREKSAQQKGKRLAQM